MKQGHFKIIYVDGTVKQFDTKPDIGAIEKLLGVKYIDTIILTRKAGEPDTIMIVDDSGMIDGKPVNKTATELFKQHYPDAPYGIHGDVAIVCDLDF